MSPDWLRWAIGIAVIAHGIGHVLFVPLLQPTLGVPSNGASSLLTAVVGEPATAWIGSVVAAATAVSFVVAGGAFIAQVDWWRPLAAGASMASIVLVAAMWGALPNPSAAFALAFDLVVMAALLIARWPLSETAGP
jgi:hypothetical protein